MIELVVFDLAGTTVYDGDSVATAFRGALAEVGIHPDPADVRDVMGLPKPEAIRVLLKKADRTPDEETVRVIHADFVTRMKAYYATSPDVREIPGASAAISTLRMAGVKTAFNTGFSRDIAEVLLKRLGWMPPAGCVAFISSDEVAQGRPYPDMILALMARLGISDASRVAKVGDTASDLGEGTAAGCSLVIGVTSGTHTADELRPYPHTHIVDSVADVPALVRGYRG